MDINIQRHLSSRMAGQVLDHFDIQPGAAKIGNIGVAQYMRGNLKIQSLVHLMILHLVSQAIPLPDSPIRHDLPQPLKGRSGSRSSGSVSDNKLPRALLLF